MLATGSQGNFARASSVFSEIYEKNIWGNGSGASAPSQTSEYMVFLQNFLKYNHVKSVVDVGCGDWQFSRHVDWGGIKYSGYDVVDSVINTNRQNFGGEDISFFKLNKVEDLPAADLVVCKDVLQHLPSTIVAEYLDYFGKHYKYAIITNDVAASNLSAAGESEVGPEYINVDIDYGQWRLIHLDKPPFNLRVASLVRWSIEAPTMKWTKESCLLIGEGWPAIPGTPGQSSLTRTLTGWLKGRG